MLGLWWSICSGFGRSIESWLERQLVSLFLVWNLIFGSISSPFGFVKIVTDVFLLLFNPFSIHDFKWEIGRVIHSRRSYTRLTEWFNSLFSTTANWSTRSCPIWWTLPVKSRLKTTLFHFLLGHFSFQVGDFLQFVLRSHMQLVWVVFHR